MAGWAGRREAARRGVSRAEAQWLICIVVGFAPVVVTEIRKIVLNRREAAEAAPSSPAPTVVS